MSAPAAPPVYSVSQITGEIRRGLEERYGRVCVRGEISNLRRPGSGHVYFALKDAGAQLRAAMFRGAALGLRFMPADGLEVLAEGEITVYEPRGDLQLVVRRMEPSGLGALMQALEALKRRLAEEGLFDPARKRPLPRYPRTVGLVTSPTGAAVRDLMHVLGRRWPVARLVLVPVRVQGEGAAAEIADALDLLNRWGEADVVIVGRGGGSIEDLWAFNEEVVARAIAASRAPVVSAVGHETDVTIADLVADLRAPTPSAAAEMVVPDGRAVAHQFRTHARVLERRLARDVAARRERLLALVQAYGFRRPDLFLAREAQRVDDLAGKLEDAVTWRVEATRRRLATVSVRLAAQDPRRRVAGEREGVFGLAGRMRRASSAGLRAARGDVEGIERALAALDPTAVLSRGYCLARDPATGAVRTRAAGLTPGTGLLVQFRHDRAYTIVERMEAMGPREIEPGEDA